MLDGAAVAWHGTSVDVSAQFVIVSPGRVRVGPVTTAVVVTVTSSIEAAVTSTVDVAVTSEVAVRGL